MISQPTTFVLVHGAWHTGHLWDPIAGLLRDAGHVVIAPTMPTEDVGACAADYARVIAEACAAASGRLVVVGQTSAGLVLPLLPELIAIGRLVYVNPLLPLIGASFADQTLADDYVMRDDVGRQFDREARSRWVERDGFRHALADDLEDREVGRLWEQLRGQARCPLREVTPLQAWPDTPSSAILYTGDRDLPVDWMRKLIRERLQIDPLELPGSQLGFLADPTRFADALLAI